MDTDTLPPIDRTRELARVRALARSGAAKSVRLAAGLSIGEVAEPVGVAPTTVWRWERGDRVPHGDAAIRYGELLTALMRGGQS